MITNSSFILHSNTKIFQNTKWYPAGMFGCENPFNNLSVRTSNHFTKETKRTHCFLRIHTKHKPTGKYFPVIGDYSEHRAMIHWQRCRFLNLRQVLSFTSRSDAVDGSEFGWICGICSEKQIPWPNSVQSTRIFLEERSGRFLLAKWRWSFSEIRQSCNNSSGSPSIIFSSSASDSNLDENLGCPYPRPLHMWIKVRAVQCYPQTEIHQVLVYSLHKSESETQTSQGNKHSPCHPPSSLQNIDMGVTFSTQIRRKWSTHSQHPHQTQTSTKETRYIESQHLNYEEDSCL